MYCEGMRSHCTVCTLACFYYCDPAITTHGTTLVLLILLIIMQDIDILTAHVI